MGEGFFFPEEEKYNVAKLKKKIKIKKKFDFCEKCKLYKNSKHPKMKYTGKGKEKILIVGEFPNVEEDKQNKQFTGTVEKFLKDKFEENGFDYNNDFWITNAVLCRSKEKKTPSTAQINYCRHHLQKIIMLFQPKKILTFGIIPLQSLIGDKISVTNITKWVGREIPDQDYQCYIFPNYHPAYILKNQKNISLGKRFNSFFQIALEWSKEFEKESFEIQICDDEKAIENLRNLNSLKKEKIAIDFETTGLKPHRKGHEILCVSITNSKLYTFSFLLNHNVKKYLIEVLKNENIKKIAHNFSFENKWSNWLLCKIEGWFWDTAISTHMLDNREKVTSLKFQTYINFGISGYNEEAKKYISSNIKGANEFNLMKEMDKEKMMEYCGMDSYFTMKLFFIHFFQFDNHLKKGMWLFMLGSQVLSELSPIRFDNVIYEKYMIELTEKIKDLHTKIMKSKEVKKWKKETPINYNSSKQLGELLFDICGWKSYKETESGLNSVSKSSLLEFDRKFTNYIVKKRELTTIKETFLSQFFRETVKIDDGYFIFPFFDLTIPKTYRSSSYNPNFQNIPIRNKAALKYCRSILIPSIGNKLLEFDFKGMEVVTSCCYHKDPNMINYVENSKNDMHRDICMDLFFRNLETYTKYERYIAKNGFVFPTFYGSTGRIYSEEDKKLRTGEITRNIWKMLNLDSLNHLQKNGIDNIFDFQKHVEEIEDYFWKKRFSVYQNWKWENWRIYKEKGYVELKTGFRCTSLMSFNDVNNYPIQGSAFHILLFCLIKLKKFFDENNIKSKIIGQIHDSIIIDLVPDEQVFIFSIMKKIIQEVQVEWDWIIVNLEIEAEITEINESWDMKKEI